MQLMNVPKDKIVEILQTWPGINHRLQYFHSWKKFVDSPKNIEVSKSVGYVKKEIEYKFYNDTCATVPEAAAAATQAFEKPVILITGGTDKGLDLDKLVQALCGKLSFDVKQVYFLDGTATQKIIPMLNQRGVHYFGPFGSLVELLQVLKTNLENQEDIDNADNLELIEENDSEIIVFSPGATSFGMFANEFDRGNQFMNAVKEIF